MQPQTLTELIYLLIYLVQLAIPIIVAFALLMFFWGLAMFIAGGAAKPDDVKKGKARMVWGIIVLLVMLSIGGILYIVNRTFIGTSYYGGYGGYGSYYNGGYNGGVYPGGGQVIRESGGALFQKAPPNEFRLCLFNRVGINCPQRLN